MRQSLASIEKKARHQKDITTSTLNKDNTNKSTTSKDRLNMVPNSNVMHMNDSVTTNKSLRRSNRKKARRQKDTTLTLNNDNNTSTTTTKDHLNDIG